MHGIGWERDEVHVEGLLDARMRRFVFEVNGNDTLVDVQLPRRSGGGWSDATDLTVHLPRESSVEISVVSTDTRVENLEGVSNSAACRAKCRSGTCATGWTSPA